MLILLTTLALLAAAPTGVAPPAPGAPRTLQCTAKNTSAGKDRKCSVKLAKNVVPQACDAASRAAGHCALEGRFVAWTVATGGARCELTRKTDWKTRVGIRVGDATRPGAGSCTLIVSVR